MFNDFISQITQLAFNDAVTLIVTIITIGGIGFTIVWNMSRKIATLENDAKARKENHINDINNIIIKIQEMDKSNIQKYSDSKIERKEEITKELSNQQNKFEMLQRQIDSVKSDVKVVASTVTEVNTKVEYLEKQTEKTETRLNCEIDYNRKRELLRDVPKTMVDKLENP